MGTRWPETCLATYKGEINIILKVTSSWSLYPHSNSYLFSLWRNVLHLWDRNFVSEPVHAQHYIFREVILRWTYYKYKRTNQCANRKY